MKKKSMIAVAVTVVAAVSAVSLICYIRGNEKTEEVVTKETTVERGNIVTGITESGSVSVGTQTQEYDLEIVQVDLTSANTGSSSTGTSNSSVSNSSGTSSQKETESSSKTEAGGASQALPGNMGTGGTDSVSGFTQTSSGSIAVPSDSTTGTSSETTLVVEEVYIAQGQKVNAGEPILKVTADSADAFREELERAAANAELALKAAELEDEETKLKAESEYEAYQAAGSVAEAVYEAEIASIDNNIASLQSQLDSTSDDAQAASLQSQLDQANREAETKKLEARQKYEETMLNYENAKELYEVSMNSVGQAAEEAQETLDTANENLAAFQSLVTDNTIYAACSGTVVTSSYAAGDSLNSETPLAEYADEGAVTIEVSVMQDDIESVTIGDEVQISFAAFADEVYSGTVTAIDAADTSSSTVSYPVTITLDTVPEKVLTGMTANVTFITKEIEDVLYVSNKAVVAEDAKSYVKVKDESGNVQQVEVTTGFSDGVHVEIQEGLKEGDTVLIESKVES
ncbi:efflux RND transporter periplasmic adaptor subunit [Lactonifactor longoviformis]|uniref:HlyD family secretion protein n=1 Tax=Lactonifactor longoviformis DSM 17459 TaxID=1122155 RepID=A0A1M4U0U7_9CLOT|nr:efflux RND transporter periplasmic adaptor subunit [Lactonifactor longoviformis]POP31770.1 efflux RND transporter periplasmic adaptor subunit [Lactonifactor longoviformis]SHE50329.1 HlyD family secretion protein [Lactonifactor longoviformis DSM 17459]